MVSSKLNTNVIYQESKKVDPEDKGEESCLYEIDIFEKQVVITLGKLKYTFANKHILYVPIYLVNPDNTIDAQIGIYEFEDNLIMKIMDDEGDIDITYMTDPLLYDFSETVVNKTKSDVIEYLSKWEKPSTDVVSNVDIAAIAAITDNAEESDEDDDNIMRLKIPKMVKSKQMEKAVKLIDTGIFSTNINLQQQPNVLSQETELEADEIQQLFKESSKNTWIQKYMKNPHYDIHEVEANGDCFFAVVRDAFKQIGKITTVAHLRAILAREVTDKLFQDYRNLFIEFDSIIKGIDHECVSIKKILENDLKQRKSKKLSDQQAIKKEVDDLREKFMELRSQRKEIKDIIDETIGDISQITTFEQFRDYIQTSQYWADTWAISTLERVLNMKMIIFSEQAYIDGAFDNSVLNCGEASIQTQTEGKFSPNFYIMTSYSGNHYRLISYKSKKILTFSEIPYHIKIMVINKCFEKNSGIYYLIEDFRNMKVRLGIDPDVGQPLEEEDNQEYSDYDSDTIFMFHVKSENKAKPGKGSGEIIHNDKISSFVYLGKMVEWRRKLDDSWINSPFKIDGHMYASITHYYQGAKFKNGFPDFAMLFSLDSKSKISEDVVLARAAGGKTGKLKTDILRPKNVIIDSDFYPIRNYQERSKALRAKFTQHSELAKILIETKRAKLVHYVARNPPEVDVDLMKLRDELTRSSQK